MASMSAGGGNRLISSQKPSKPAGDTTPSTGARPGAYIGQFVRYAPRSKNERSWPRANCLVAALDFVITRENIEGFIFLVVRMQGGTAARRGRFRQHSERAIRLLPRDQERYEISQNVQVGAFAGTKDDRLIGSEERHPHLQNEASQPRQLTPWPWRATALNDAFGTGQSDGLSSVRPFGQRSRALSRDGELRHDRRFRARVRNTRPGAERQSSVLSNPQADCQKAPHLGRRRGLQCLLPSSRRGRLDDRNGRKVDLCMTGRLTLVVPPATETAVQVWRNRSPRHRTQILTAST